MSSCHQDPDVEAAHETRAARAREGGALPAEETARQGGHRRERSADRLRLSTIIFMLCYSRCIYGVLE